MQVELKEVLHLYLGCECETDQGKGTLCIVSDGSVGCGGGWSVLRTEDSEMLHDADCEWIKPILRDLSTMRQEDCPAWFKEWMPDGFEIFHNKSNTYCYVEVDSNADGGYKLTIHTVGSMNCECKDNGEQYGYRGAALFNHLLKQGFDLFNLIPSGQAIKKESLISK